MWLPLALWVFSQPASPAAVPQGLGAGARAPRGLTLPLLDGRLVDLDALIAERDVYLTFFSTDCDISATELPAVRQFIYENPGVLVLGVDYGGNTPEDYAAYQAQNGVLPFQVLLDPDRDAARDFRVRGTPTSFAIGKGGLIRYGRVGGGPGITAEQIARWMNFDPDA